MKKRFTGQHSSGLRSLDGSSGGHEGSASAGRNSVTNAGRRMRPQSRARWMRLVPPIFGGCADAQTSATKQLADIEGLIGAHQGPLRHLNEYARALNLHRIGF
ncbi:MAG: hypothetical protein JWS10_264 [Cypionkella sp.]|nr:hypothetical protein [Cypionkella sp.]